jgi:hypothetical protein
MDIERITTHTDHPVGAHEAIRASLGDGPVDYAGRHVGAGSDPTSSNPHPRGHGFRVLSRLARASADGEHDRSVLVLAS